MKTNYKSLLKKWTLRRWRPVVFAAHGHVSAVFKVRRLHTLSKYALKVFRGEESEERIGAFRRGIVLGDDAPPDARATRVRRGARRRVRRRSYRRREGGSELSFVARRRLGSAFAFPQRLYPSSLRAQEHVREKSKLGG